jgi:hypothetical protein
VAEARELLDGAADLGGNPALEDMFAALEATHRARARLSGLLGKLGRWLQYEAEETVRALRKTTPPDEPPVRAVEEAAAELTKELAAMKEPEEAPALLTPERLRGLNETWRDAVEKQLAGTAFLDEERAKVITLLDGRNYAAAAQAAQVVITQKRRKMLGTARGGAGESAAEAAASTSTPPAEAARAADNAPPSPATLPRVLRAEVIPPPVLPSRAQTYRELLREKFLLFALSGVGIALVGYLLFEGRFVGTFADLAVVFLWAFGIDVTVDAFVRVAKGAEPRSSG